MCFCLFLGQKNNNNIHRENESKRQGLIQDERGLGNELCLGCLKGLRKV